MEAPAWPAPVDPETLVTSVAAESAAAVELEAEIDRQRQLHEAYADAADIFHEGISAKVCSDSARSETGEQAHFSLDAPTLTETRSEKGNVITNCPSSAIEQASDQVSAMVLGGTLLLGYGAVKASEWWSEVRKSTSTDS